MKKEINPPAILYQYTQTGEVPKGMLPLQDNQVPYPDPSKPLRGAFEGIWLARAAPIALELLAKNFVEQKGTARFNHHMLPISEIDEEKYLYNRSLLLRRKAEFVLRNYYLSLEEALVFELSRGVAGELPEKVNSAYSSLVAIDDMNLEVAGIMFASESQQKEIVRLFEIAEVGYPQVLGYDPSARQMVNLVGNSYLSFVHPQTAIHQEVDLRGVTEKDLGTKYTIDTTTANHRVVLLNPHQYHEEEKRMRTKGVIQDQRIHCPFAMHSVATAPFLDNPADAYETNPLQQTFETLVREYVGT